MPTGHIPILQIKTKDGKWLPVNAIGGQVASKVLYNNAYPTVEQALDYLFKNGTGGGGTGGSLTAENISYTVSQDIQDQFPELAVLESDTVKNGLDLAMYYALAGMLAENIAVDFQTSGGTSSISLQNLYDYSILPAIEEAHEHSNKPVLDNLSVSNGKLQYNGSDISVTKNGVINALGYTPEAVSAQVATGSNITLADNTEYRLTDVTTLSLSYPTGKFECWMRLTFAASGNITVTLPTDTEYLGATPNFKNGETWELSFKDKVLAAKKVGDDDGGAGGENGVTPHIGDNGNWYIGSTDTGKPSRGVAGARGDTGATGADGKTPVKGTDYWTVADKQEIVNDVIAVLPDGTEVSY
jgi:hypothetical protein